MLGRALKRISIHSVPQPSSRKRTKAMLADAAGLDVADSPARYHRPIMYACGMHAHDLGVLFYERFYLRAELPDCFLTLDGRFDLELIEKSSPMLQMRRVPFLRRLNPLPMLVYERLNITTGRTDRGRYMHVAILHNAHAQSPAPPVFNHNRHPRKVSKIVQKGATALDCQPGDILEYR